MEIDSVAAGSCSKENQIIYKDWFEFADSDGDGRITGSDAIKFFSMSNLPRPELKQVWAIADAKRQGYLGFKEFIVAMQLVSLAQTGHEISHEVLHSDVDFKNMNPPVMDGLIVLMAVSIWACIFHFMSFKFEYMLLTTVHLTTQKKKKHSPKSSDPNGSPAADASLTAHWFSSNLQKRFISLSSVTSIIDGLKRLYIQKLKPLEVAYQFNDFVSPLLTNSDFDAKPMVMLLGQYSTGKTTFIKHMLKSSYPGAHIGPEPTTDRFVVVMSGPDERSIPGNTVAVQADMPFSGLTSFGTAFLSKFECSQMPHPLLEHITFVDTPGVLSGEKQRTQRAYEFTGVTSWFASKCDLILLLFDPHKLDVSDEFKRVISSLRGHDDKIRVVLNKADQVDTQQLMRVYGALMWSLGKVLNTPEVARVYIGSFSDKPINEASTGPIGRELFEMEQEDLLSDLKNIPKKACDRRINEFVKRARAAKIHAYIISHLKKEMPAIMGKAKAQQKLMDNLEDVFGKVQREHHLPKGDFPNVDQFREVLSGYNFDKFEKLKPKMLQTVDDMLGYDIPELLKNFKNPYD
ncbi:EH domain-containing protein 1 isoform X1 [Brassica napus]|uniref:EH domain-containing protein 1 isoform X1 n=1 Tax=Brassica napus TaxID=3708 RepID=UPI002078B648|nr:EH domain-containing protein 1 isoform X1 [Brassica napus]